MPPHDRSRAPSDHPVVCVFGDSIAMGLGAYPRRYPVLVAEAFEAELLDATRSAQEIFTSLEMAHLADRADVVIIAHGVTEGLVRPSARTLRRMPGRYGVSWMLDPRPYFSSRLWKAAGQRIESVLRVATKRGLMAIGTPAAWRTPGEFEMALGNLVDRVTAPGRTVVLVGPGDLERRWFPGSPASLSAMADVTARVAHDRGAVFVETRRALHRWDHFLADRFHPNTQGHEVLARLVLARLLERGTPGAARRAEASR